MWYRLGIDRWSNIRLCKRRLTTCRSPCSLLRHRLRMVRTSFLVFQPSCHHSLFFLYFGAHSFLFFEIWAILGFSSYSAFVLFAWFYLATIFAIFIIYTMKYARLCCHSQSSLIIIHWRPTAHCLFNTSVYLLFLFGYVSVPVPEVPS